jgi:hypothetical protein
MIINTHTDDQDLDGPEIVTCPNQSATAIAPVPVANCHSLIEPLERSLQNARTFEEVKEYRDQAESLRVLMRNRNTSLEDQNKATTVKIRAERRLGNELSALQKAKGGGDRRSDHRSHDATGGLPTLADLGIRRHNLRAGRLWRLFRRTISSDTSSRSITAGKSLRPLR